METYQETILRFQIQRHDELPEEHKIALREKGVDPDTRWSLMWSFNKREDAQEQLDACQNEAASYETYRLVDAGSAQTITRPVW